MSPEQIASLYGESAKDVRKIVEYAESVRHEYWDPATEEYGVTALAQDCEWGSDVVVDEEVYYEVAYYVCYEREVGRAV